MSPSSPAGYQHLFRGTQRRPVDEEPTDPLKVNAAAVEAKVADAIVALRRARLSSLDPRHRRAITAVEAQVSALALNLLEASR